MAPDDTVRRSPSVNSPDGHPPSVCVSPFITGMFRPVRGNSIQAHLNEVFHEPGEGTRYDMECLGKPGAVGELIKQALAGGIWRVNSVCGSLVLSRGLRSGVMCLCWCIFRMLVENGLRLLRVLDVDESRGRGRALHAALTIGLISVISPVCSPATLSVPGFAGPLEGCYTTHMISHLSNRPPRIAIP